MGRKRSKIDRRFESRAVSEPFPVNRNIDFQKLFSFPLTINHFSTHDNNSNTDDNPENISYDLKKLISRRKPQLTKGGDQFAKFLNESECKIIQHSAGYSNENLTAIEERQPEVERQDGDFTCSSLSDVQPPAKPPRKTTRREFICKHCGFMEQLRGQVELLFKSCVYCFTHYCSAECQNKDLKSHYKYCFYGKIYYYIEKLKKILVSNKNMNQEYYNFS